MSRDYSPWEWLWERVALPTCLRMINSETVRKVSQTITSGKRSPNTKHSQEELQKDTSQHRDQVVLIQICSPSPLCLSSPLTNEERRSLELVPCQS